MRRKDKEIRFESRLWEKYSPIFSKMEDTLRSCKTEKHLRTAMMWIDEVLTNYKEAETEGKPSKTREIAEEYMMKKTDTFNEIYAKMFREMTKGKDRGL